MKVQKNFVFKTLASCETGELIVMPVRRQRSISIVLNGDPIRRTIGILDMPDLQHPKWLDYTHSPGNVLSFGQDWVIEPILDESSFPGNTSFVEAPGALHIDPDGVTIHFAPSTETGNPLDWHAEKRTFRQPSSGAAPIASWLIWESPEHRQDPKSSPLLSFTATGRT